MKSCEEGIKIVTHESLISEMKELETEEIQKKPK